MEDLIRLRAYEMWEADGRRDGRDLDYWFKAAAEITTQAMVGARALRQRRPDTKKAA